MLKRLLTVIAICLCFFFTAQPQQASAQVHQSTFNYITYMQYMVLVQLKSTLAQPTLTPTPTMYQTPTTSPTPMKVQAPSITISSAAFPTQKVITPTSKVAPITMQTPTAKPSPTKVPITPATDTSTDPLSYMIDEINAYRASQGLGPIKTSTETCNFAAIRAVEITTNFSHDGFQSRIDNKTLPYAHWSRVTENIAMTSNAHDVVTMWKNSPGHAANMRADTPYVCVRQSGNYFAYEGMNP